MIGYKLEYSDSQQEHQKLWESIKVEKLLWVQIKVKNLPNIVSNFYSEIILGHMHVYLKRFMYSLSTLPASAANGVMKELKEYNPKNESRGIEDG